MQKLNLPETANKLKFKICLFKGLHSVNFSVHGGHYDLLSHDNHVALNQTESPSLWRAKVTDGQQAVYSYYLVLAEADQKSYLIDFQRTRYPEQQNAKIREFGGKICNSTGILGDNHYFALLTGPYESEDIARKEALLFGLLENCRIHKEEIKKGTGSVELLNTDNEYLFEVQDGFKIITDSESAYIKFHHIEINNCQRIKSFHENLYFYGPITFEFDETATLRAILEINLESYVEGALLSEVGRGVPFEFARTMALIFRTQAIYRYRIEHALEPFDYCSTGHCLRFYGNLYDDSLISEAVKSTFGQILISDSEVADVRHTYSCGGFRENDIRNQFRHGYKIGKSGFDFFPESEVPLNLKTEKGVRQWIASKPDTLCNSDHAPDVEGVQLGQNAFRWEVFYTRLELEEILFSKTGENLGTIYDLIPLRRSKSGRIEEIQILASLKNLHITGDQNICSALAEQTLKSSCFIIKSELGEDGIPINFTLIGAGMGPGLGLCKVGACTLASTGHSSEEIINHYFNNLKIMEIY